MATTTIDPRKPGQYTLKIGKGLKSGSGSASSSYSKVKFNHKPSLSNGLRTTKISRKEDGTASLSIKDNENGKTSKYSYNGRRSSNKNSYVLIFDQEAQTCTLEPVRNSYNFNLTSTPWETDKDKLAKTYDQLSLEEKSSDPVSVDLDPDGEPDKENPYDFRHYLNLNSRPSPSPSPALRPTSTVQTPHQEPARPRAISTASKPQARSTPKVDPLRQAPRKQSSTTTSTKEIKTSTRPTIRLERKASTRPGDPAPKKAAPTSSKSNVKSDYYVHSSDDEDSPPLPSKSIDAEESGGLEIDWGNERPKPRQQVPKRTTVASASASLDLPGDLGDGPISLHSAANSPAGRIIPRKQKKRRQDYEADVIDFGTSDINDEEEEDSSPPQEETREEDDDTQMVDVGSENDTDVEPMQLGSPAHAGKMGHEPLVKVDTVMEENSGAGVEDEVDYDDDDDLLEAEMMKAMEEEVEAEVAEDESDVSEAE